MKYLIETAEDDLMHQIGRLVFENTALRHRVSTLEQRLRELEQQKGKGDRDE